MPQCAPSRTPVITRRSWSFAEPRARAGITEGAHLDPSEIERRRKDLDMAKDFLSERGIEAKTIAPQDDPGDVVVDVVTDADLAVVGSGGPDPLQRLLLGRPARRSSIVHGAMSSLPVGASRGSGSVAGAQRRLTPPRTRASSEQIRCAPTRPARKPCSRHERARAQASGSRSVTSARRRRNPSIVA